ncbi:MAG: choice-of-anchor I family protein, partial [Verrucomicrobiae bacterium]|nr:choice-of-anchor I family protein [Verrucomicrobiae bacterium]
QEQAPNGNQVASINQSATTDWPNGWTSWNPVPGAAYLTFTGGIQNHFGQPGTLAFVDLQRIEPNQAGTYETTIAIAENGDVFLATGFFDVTPTAPVNGSITGIDPGGETLPSGTVLNLTATPDAGFTFVEWLVDNVSAGSANPLALNVTANTTVAAVFAKDLSDTDGDGISAHDEIVIHGTDPGIANTPPAFPSGTNHLGTLGGLAGAEISAFDPASERLFVTSGAGLQVIDLSDPANPSLLSTIDLSAAPFSAVSNDISSVAVNDGVVAAAVLNANKEAAGSVVFLTAATAGIGTGHLSTVTVGHHPDMVTFTPDGMKVLVANEGEYLFDPDGDSNPGVGGPGVTPGSVSIIDVSGGFGSPGVTNVGFTAFDAQAAALKAAGVRIFGAELPSNDLEPEYIAVSPDGATAVVTLQEANAVAILDIGTASFTSIEPLGLKDFSGLYADFSDRDNGSNGPIGKLTMGNPVFGLYMPDAIAAFEYNSATYYLVANEGDDRDDVDLDAGFETARVNSLDLNDTTFPTETDLKQNANLGRLTVTTIGENGDALGSPVDQILALGGRSFSIYDETGTLVYDSGDDIEKRIHSFGAPPHDDSRSDNKAAEPEGAVIGVVNGKTLAFVGLERSNGVMVYDISDPMAPVFVSFLSHAGDVSPEGLTFVPATESPNNKALLVVTNEVSNTVTVYGFDEITYNLT